MKFLNMLLVVCLTVGICDSRESLAAPSSAPIRVGVISPLTGALAEYGVATRNGIDLARNNHPELFEGLQFVYEDSAYDPKTSLAAFNKLRSIDKVNVVVDWGAQTSQAIAPVAETSRFPFISVSIEPAVSTGREYVVRFHSDANQYARTIVSFLEARKLKKIALFKAEIVYFNKILEGLRNQLPPSISIDVLSELSPGETDFKTSLSKLKAGSYDAVGVFLLSGQIAQFYKQMHQLSITLPTFGTDFFDSPSEIASSNGLMNGAVFPVYGSTDAFRDNYRARFKNSSQLPYAALAYDLAMHLARSFSSVDANASGEKLIQAFTGLSRAQGITGQYEFEHSPQNGKSFKFPFVLKEIRDGIVVDYKVSGVR